MLIIKAVQAGTFKKEIEMLTSTRAERPRPRQNPQVSKTSCLYKLDPFVDDDICSEWVVDYDELI
jgi:hypothetical protein